MSIHPTAIINCPPLVTKSLARPWQDHPECVIDPTADVGPFAVLYYGVTVMEHTLIGEKVSIQGGTVIGPYSVIGRMVSIGYDVKIGARVKMMDMSHITGGTEIGDNTFIGVGVLMSNDDDPREYEWKGHNAPKIGSNVMIGTGANIRAGVRIGDNAIIGSHAMVTRDVKPHEVVLGPPARVVIKKL